MKEDNTALIGCAELKEKSLREELKEYRETHEKPWYLI